MLVVQKNMRGYIYWYLMCLSIVEMPYYMGRSVLPTLYNVSLPFILSCGMFLEDAIKQIHIVPKNWLAWSAIVICGYVLAVGSMRGGVAMGINILHSAEIVDASIGYIQEATTQWKVKKTKQYQFIQQYLPKDCPLGSFDDTYEYIPALGVPPAFNYPFMRGIISSRQQVDTLIPHAGSQYICFFVDTVFIDIHDDLSYGVYSYFWDKYAQYATLLASDSSKGYTLYSIPTNVFVANTANH
jgi:hypothetical protein